MSKLDKLIHELCPNGVEYIPIINLAEIGTGSHNTNEELDDGKYPFFVRSQTPRRLNTYDFDEKAIITAGDGVGVGKVFHYIEGKYALHQRAYRIHVTSDKLEPKYLLHYMKASFLSYMEMNAVNSSVTSVRKPMLEKYRIPVPPLEIQYEIIRILDSFAAISSELNAELGKELTARKKQYNYYRDTLLSFDNTVKKVKLKDIAVDIYRGAGIKREEVTETGIPCVRYGEIYTTYNTWFDACVSHTKLEYVSNPKYFEHGDILFAITGESVEDIAKSVAYIGNEKCLAGGDIVVLKHNQEPRYLAHVLSTYESRQQKSRGKIKSKVVHSSVPAIEDIEIPLPSIEVQRRYADVLDYFEKICNDLNIGLPAEIEARKKQYEYYRDVLLTFAECGEMILDRQTDRQNIIRLIQYVFGVIYLELGSVVKVFRGEYITKKDTASGNVPVILGGQEPAYYIDKSNHKGEVVVVARSGASAGFVSYWNQPVFITDGFGYDADENTLIPKYLYYILKNMEKQFNDMKRGAGVPHISGDALLETKIPIISLSEQERIVAILDRFDTLCNDISEGLPAEIEARQKQYEYYRDKLLNFIEKI